ncbi:Sua5/YciO/YrdC/YwlC family protein [Rubidibacter lacunae KORDI 51-2]|uniref:Sua5/YciO/YrdC/YwlC family protein n=1 Tax=Rubidibacter lacunae KORDI 51-2 TaxID=582515 RepID=U5DRQ2_9CHRO|nr:L-threonylcarbamoyladenylate synthase [Rubidibacter lacunae]ERN42370.1 Sua5/YciO/YrdC/YwlC family protein [Rubidibacter lacunae KORDI 51-2]
MAAIYTVHPQNPQMRSLDEIASALRRGAVMLYPSDTVYAIGCDLNAKSAVTRVRQLKQLANDKPLTFLCESLSDVAQYARVDDSAYRFMKRLIPGPYTFLLPATKLVPRLVLNPKRKTTGLRVPDRVVCRALIAALGNPIVSTSAYLPPEEPEEPSELPAMGTEKAVLFDRLDKHVDLIVDDGTEPGALTSTIIDLTTGEPEIVRQGAGWEEVAVWI